MNTHFRDLSDQDLVRSLIKYFEEDMNESLSAEKNVVGEHLLELDRRFCDSEWTNDWISYNGSPYALMALMECYRGSR